MWKTERSLIVACLLPAVGLDAAGKTTILYKLKLGEVITTIPTIGELLSLIAGNTGELAVVFMKVCVEVLSQLETGT